MRNKRYWGGFPLIMWGSLSFHTQKFPIMPGKSEKLWDILGVKKGIGPHHFTYWHFLSFLCLKIKGINCNYTQALGQTGFEIKFPKSNKVHTHVPTTNLFVLVQTWSKSLIFDLMVAIKWTLVKLQENPFNYNY